MNKKLFQNGLAHDTRSDMDKARDYRKPETGLPITWIEKPESEWKRYTPREQSSSLSCMAQSGAKAIETISGIVESAHPPYRRRSNYPEGGMWTQDLGNLIKNLGTTTELLDISQNQNETLLNRTVDVPTPIKIGGYFFVNPNSIDDIAYTILNYKHCILIVHGCKKEWTAIPQADSLEIPANYDFGHACTAIDYFSYKGQKALLIEDSTGHFNSLDGKGRRIITEEFLKARIVDAMYFIVEIPVPPFKFTQTMKIGSKGAQVVELQKFLNKFEKSTLITDGWYGLKTATIVKLFQQHHGLVEDSIFGLKSRTVANLMI